jgi:predicted DNA-binding transcriptional regulator AlpA
VTVGASTKPHLANSFEVAEHLGVGEKTLRRWRWPRQGPRWSKVGRYVCFRWEDVEAWLDKQATGGEAA